MMNLPQIGISYIDSIPEEIFLEFRDNIFDQNLDLRIEPRSDGDTHAVVEWLLPTAVVVYFAKSYFDGFLKEMGKDHYQLLKKGMNLLRRKLLEDSGHKITLISTQGKVSKDFYSRDSGRYKRALSFIDFITNNGLIPFFSLHHLEEILQHENDMIVQDRLSFIRKFPAVAWLKSVNNSGIVGSILDIQGMELKRIIETPDIKIPDLISEVWKELIQYSSGEEFLDRFEDLLWQLREFYPFETQSKKTTASISYAVFCLTKKQA